MPARIVHSVSGLPYPLRRLCKTAVHHFEMHFQKLFPLLRQYGGPDTVVAVKAGQQQRRVPRHNPGQNEHAQTRAPSQVRQRERQRRVGWARTETFLLDLASDQAPCR